MLQAVAGILINGTKVLIGKKIEKEGHFLSGGWHLPGGHMNENETAEHAIVREFKEETNLDVIILKKLTSIHLEIPNITVTWFVLNTHNNDIVARDDLSDALFIDKEKVISACDVRTKEWWPQEVIDFLSS